jgi:DNA-directed RNA polymerase specialized sigma24 family protein
VFFDVWQQAGRFEGRSAVSTWLLSIARFKTLSAPRRRTDAELDETIEARPWRTVPTTLKWCCRKKAAASSCAEH